MREREGEIERKGEREKEREIVRKRGRESERVGERKRKKGRKRMQSLKQEKTRKSEKNCWQQFFPIFVRSFYTPCTKTCAIGLFEFGATFRVAAFFSFRAS